MKLVKIKRLKGEVFKLIPTTERYYVSNQGRALKTIKDKDTEATLEHLCKITKSKNKTGKYYSDIRIKQIGSNDAVIVRLTRAIAKTFLDKTRFIL